MDLLTSIMDVIQSIHSNCEDDYADVCDLEQ